jgi:hypothetical protein
VSVVPVVLVVSVVPVVLVVSVVLVTSPVDPPESPSVAASVVGGVVTVVVETSSTPAAGKPLSTRATACDPDV